MDNEELKKPRHNLGDTVLLEFYKCGRLMHCTIEGIHYKRHSGIIRYDVAIYPHFDEEGDEDFKIILKDIDEHNVRKEWDEPLGRFPRVTFIFNEDVCPVCGSYDWSYHMSIDKMKCGDCGKIT